MSVTLGQLRTRVYNHLQEDSASNTHFSDTTIIDGYLNEGVEYAAVFIEYPRDLVSVQVSDGVGSYPNPADNLILRTAYFGNRDSISNDIRPLLIVSEETLKEKFPSWLDQTTSSKSDRPEYLIQLDRNTIYIYPRPNAAGSASGKKIYLNYNYVPAVMSNDSDVPDLPLPYQSLIPFYALHLCYYDLGNEKLSAQFYKDFMEKVQRIKSAVTKESKEGLSFQWGNSEGLNDPAIGGVGF